MRLLIDTHVLIWLAEGMNQLSVTSRQLLDRVAAADGLGVSAISFWETAMLAQRGRISLSQPIGVWRTRVLSTPGITEAVIDSEVAIESVQLTGELHADPADRIIVATARVNGWRLATRDQRLLDYGAAGHVRVIAV